MKILSFSSVDVWPFGRNKGIPSIYASQKGFVDHGHKVYFLCPLKIGNSSLKENYHGICIYRFRLPFKINILSVYNFSLNNIWDRIRSTIVFNLEWLFFQVYCFIYGVKLASHIRPDLIYAHGLTSVFPAYLISRLFKAKLVVRVYGTRDLYWKWQSLWYQFKECRDYISFKVPADYFVITNDGTHADLLAQKLGVPKEKIMLWRNGVDFGIYDPDPRIKEEVSKKYGINPSDKIIISTSRLLSLYGLDRLVSALPGLFKKNGGVKCIIAGEGPEKKPLEEFVYRHGIQSKVLFLEMVDHGTIKQLLNAADIFVLLSRYHNCTNTMWEAMACGKCIVTIENEAIKEVLASGENAILITPDKLNNLTDILCQLLDNDKLRNRLAKNVRRRAQEILEPWPERIDREVRLLEELIRK